MQSQVSLEGGRGTLENATVLVMEEGPRNPTTQGMQLQKLEQGRGGDGFSWSLQREQVKVKVTQSCLTLCDPMDYRVHGILQGRILEWVAFPFSRGSSQPRDQIGVS